MPDPAPSDDAATASTFAALKLLCLHVMTLVPALQRDPALTDRQLSNYIHALAA